MGSSLKPGIARATAITVAIVVAATAVAAADAGAAVKRYGYWEGGYPYDGSDGGSNSNIFGGSDGFPGISGSSLERAMHYRTVHGILAAVSIVVLMPVGAILMRIVPGRFAIWIHAGFQVLAFLLFVAGASLGFYLVHTVRIPFLQGSLLSSNAHPIMGIVTFVLLSFQPLLGFIHHARFKQLGRRTIWSYLHLWNGRIGISLGIITGGLGLRMAHASRSAKTAYAIVAAIVWFFWLVAAVFGELRRWRSSRRGNGRRAAPASSSRQPPLPPSGRRGRRERRFGGRSSSSPPEMSTANAAPLRRPGGRHRSPKVSVSQSGGSRSREASVHRYA